MVSLFLHFIAGLTRSLNGLLTNFFGVIRSLLTLFPSLSWPMLGGKSCKPETTFTQPSIQPMPIIRIRIRIGWSDLTPIAWIFMTMKVSRVMMLKTTRGTTSSKPLRKTRPCVMIRYLGLYEVGRAVPGPTVWNTSKIITASLALMNRREEMNASNSVLSHDEPISVQM